MSDSELSMEPKEPRRSFLTTTSGFAMTAGLFVWPWIDAVLRRITCNGDFSVYVQAFYKQYDDFVVNYNEKFAKPGQKIMAVLKEQKLITPKYFDEEIEWTRFYLWHHEGRRARHGA